MVVLAHTARAALERLATAPLIVPYQVALGFVVGSRDPTFLGASSVLDAPDATFLGRSAASTAKRVDAAVWVAAAAALRDFVVSSNKRHFTALDVPSWNFMRGGGAVRPCAKVEGKDGL